MTVKLNVDLGQTPQLADGLAYVTGLPRVVRRDRYDYPKVVRWPAAGVTLERIWCLSDRACAADCGTPIAAHQFYVRLTDHWAPPTGPFIRDRRVFVPVDLHPACLPDRVAPALLRLEVPSS